MTPDAKLSERSPEGNGAHARIAVPDGVRSASSPLAMVKQTQSVPSDGPELERTILRKLEHDLLTLNRHVIGGLDSDPDRVAVDLDDGDANLRADMKTLAELPAQD
jgi:hypothetical protein